MPILVAITGGSGSGKSTLAETLVAALPPGSAVLVREDSYYRDAASLPGFDAATFDFDDGVLALGATWWVEVARQALRA